MKTYFFAYQLQKCTRIVTSGDGIFTSSLLVVNDTLTDLKKYIMEEELKAGRKVGIEYDFVQIIAFNNVE